MHTDVPSKKPDSYKKVTGFKIRKKKPSKYPCCYCRKTFCSVKTMLAHKKATHKGKVHRLPLKSKAQSAGSQASAKIQNETRNGQTMRGKDQPIKKKQMNGKETRSDLRRKKSELDGERERLEYNKFLSKLAENIATNLLYNVDGRAEQLNLRESKITQSSVGDEILLRSFSDFDVQRPVDGIKVRPEPERDELSLFVTGLQKNTCLIKNGKNSNVTNVNESDMAIKNDTVVRIICVICKKIFENNAEFKLHFANNHPSVEPTQLCFEGTAEHPPHIPEEFKKRHNFSAEGLLSTSNNLVLSISPEKRCTKCNAMFDNRNDFYAHIFECGGPILRRRTKGWKDSVRLLRNGQKAAVHKFRGGWNRKVGFVQKKEFKNKKRCRRSPLTTKRKRVTVCSLCDQQFANDVRLKEHVLECCAKKKKDKHGEQRLNSRVSKNGRFSESPPLGSRNSGPSSHSAQNSTFPKSLKNKDANSQPIPAAEKIQSSLHNGEDSSEISIKPITSFDVRAFTDPTHINALRDVVKNISPLIKKTPSSFVIIDDPPKQSNVNLPKIQEVVKKITEYASSSNRKSGNQLPLGSLNETKESLQNSSQVSIQSKKTVSELQPEAEKQRRKRKPVKVYHNKPIITDDSLVHPPLLKNVSSLPKLHHVFKPIEDSQLNGSPQEKLRTKPVLETTENASVDLLENAKHKFPGATFLSQDETVNTNISEDRDSPTLEILVNSVNQSIENFDKPSLLDDVLPPSNVDSSENVSTSQNSSKNGLNFTLVIPTIEISSKESSSSVVDTLPLTTSVPVNSAKENVLINTIEKSNSMLNVSESSKHSLNNKNVYDEINSSISCGDKQSFQIISSPTQSISATFTSADRPANTVALSESAYPSIDSARNTASIGTEKEVTCLNENLLEGKTVEKISYVEKDIRDKNKMPPNSLSNAKNIKNETAKVDVEPTHALSLEENSRRDDTLDATDSVQDGSESILHAERGQVSENLPKNRKRSGRFSQNKNNEADSTDKNIKSGFVNSGKLRSFRMKKPNASLPEPSETTESKEVPATKRKEPIINSSVTETSQPYSEIVESDNDEKPIVKKPRQEIQCKNCLLNFSYVKNYKRHLDKCKGGLNLGVSEITVASTHTPVLQHLPKKDEVETSILNLYRHQVRQTRFIQESQKDNTGETEKSIYSKTCELCHKIFLNRCNFWKHQLNEHNICKPKICSDNTSTSKLGEESRDSSVNKVDSNPEECQFSEKDLAEALTVPAPENSSVTELKSEEMQTGINSPLNSTSCTPSEKLHFINGKITTSTPVAGSSSTPTSHNYKELLDASFLVLPSYGKGRGRKKKSSVCGEKEKGDDSSASFIEENKNSYSELKNNDNVNKKTHIITNSTILTDSEKSIINDLKSSNLVNKMRTTLSKSIHRFSNLKNIATPPATLNGAVESQDRQMNVALPGTSKTAVMSDAVNTVSKSSVTNETVQDSEVRQSAVLETPNPPNKGKKRPRISLPKQSTDSAKKKRELGTSLSKISSQGAEASKLSDDVKEGSISKSSHLTKAVAKNNSQKQNAPNPYVPKNKSVSRTPRTTPTPSRSVDSSPIGNKTRNVKALTCDNEPVASTSNLSKDRSKNASSMNLSHDLISEVDDSSDFKSSQLVKKKVCAICKQKFADTTARNLHMQLVHSRDKIRSEDLPAVPVKVEKTEKPTQSPKANRSSFQRQCSRPLPPLKRKYNKADKTPPSKK
ncbi:uncharacterized protein CDAR_405221 [Caerostris darwini]|uniref:C2H2-type domain-containing protein n=1 Tax=Caerostris darwini TaxID=1538125 RepID=A0AAV4QG10_9ARAC|nr:uncharacterized protein CDAR_405221 [Caerostris darwini]